MKSLVESLFDKELVSKDLPWVEMLDFCKPNKNRIADISRLLIDIWKHDGDLKWLEHMLEEGKKLGQFFAYTLTPPNMLKNLYNPKTEGPVVESHIKPGKIHKGMNRLTPVYLNMVGILMNVWGELNDVSEWIFYVYDDIPFVIINRKTYDEPDQQVIHAIIANIHKYYKKGAH